MVTAKSGRIGWHVDDDLDPDDEDDQLRMRMPSHLSDSGLRWKYALVEMRARREARLNHQPATP